MRPYGFENSTIAGPDVADIHLQGRKSSVGNHVGRGGDIRSGFHNAAGKQAARRRGARAARRAGRGECVSE